jgi:hypothetical protein
LGDAPSGNSSRDGNGALRPLSSSNARGGFSRRTATGCGTSLSRSSGKGMLTLIHLLGGRTSEGFGNQCNPGGCSNQTILRSAGGRWDNNLRLQPSFGSDQCIAERANLALNLRRI